MTAPPARAGMPATAARLSPSRAELAPGVVWKGNADLIPLLKPLADLVPDAENAKIHPEANLAAIRESLGMLSQYKPLTGWRPAEGSKIVVMAGNGTFESIRALGWTHAAVTVYEGKPHAARTLAIIDNKTAELSTWNEELVARQIETCTAAWNVETVVPLAEVAVPVVEEVRPVPVAHVPLERPKSHRESKDDSAKVSPAPGPLTFARALAIKIAEIAPGPHRVGLIDMAIRRVFEKAAKVADDECGRDCNGTPTRIRALADEVAE